MLKIENSCLLIIDIQDKLINKIPNSTEIIQNTNKLISACETLNIPILLTEQYPKGLGFTHQDISKNLKVKPFEKLSFSVMGDKTFAKALKETGKSDIIIVGIETHICVYQSSIELNEHGYKPHIVQNAIGSRNLADHNIALEKCRHHSISITSLEMILFELLKTAQHPQFKNISQLVKA